MKAYQPAHRRQQSLQANAHSLQLSTAKRGFHAPSLQLFASNPIQKADKELSSRAFRDNATLKDVLNGNIVLEKGDAGTAVTHLQKALVSAGSATPATGMFALMHRALGNNFQINGSFDEATEKAVSAYQTAHGLGIDGKVGKKTMGSMDQYLRLEPGTAPPKAGSKEAQLKAILSKGAAMTKAEAQQAEQLLFQLKDDDFKVVLKEMKASGDFTTLFAKLGFIDGAKMFNKIGKEVVIPTALLKPATDTIDADFTRANAIYNPHGIKIKKGDQVTISERTTKKILNGDTNLNEFTTSSATAEELNLIKRNRVKGRISGYWVPSMDSSRGEALMKSHLSNMPGDSTSVVVDTGSRAQDTFAHEVGHILGLDHNDASADNLMASGGVRNISGAGIDKLTAAELTTIKSSIFMEIGKK